MLELQISTSETAPWLMNVDANIFPKKCPIPRRIQLNPSAVHVLFQQL